MLERRRRKRKSILQRMTPFFRRGIRRRGAAGREVQSQKVVADVRRFSANVAKQQIGDSKKLEPSTDEGANLESVANASSELSDGHCLREGEATEQHNLRGNLLRDFSYPSSTENDTKRKSSLADILECRENSDNEEQTGVQRMDEDQKDADSMDEKPNAFDDNTEFFDCMDVEEGSQGKSLCSDIAEGNTCPDLDIDLSTMSACDDGAQFEWNAADEEFQGQLEDSSAKSSPGKYQTNDLRNPEELFAQGEVVTVEIVKGKHKSCSLRRIVDIKKRVKVSIEENGTTTETWLARESLAFMGVGFPPYKRNPEELFAQGEAVTVEIVGGKHKSCRKGRIIEIKERVKVSIKENGTTTETWLARESLAFMGVGFPPYKGNPEELFAQGKAVTVEIVGGKHKSCRKGRIIDIKERVKVSIKENGTTTVTWLARESLAFMGVGFPPYKEKKTTSASEASCTESEKDAGGLPCPYSPESVNFDDGFQRNDRVWIVGGKYKKREGTVVEVRTEVKVAVDGLKGREPWLARRSLRRNVDGQASGVKAESQRKAEGKESQPKAEGRLASFLGSEEDWRLLDGTTGGKNWGQRSAVKIRLESDPVEGNLLSFWMQSRVCVTEITMDKNELKEPIPEHVETPDGSKYELVVSKIQSDRERASPFGAPARKCIQLYYCKVSGPGLQTISLKEELERIADFGSLEPEKACARLQLFLSPAYKFKSPHPLKKSHAIFILKPSAYSKIAERGNEGCGFISTDFLHELLGGRKSSQKTYAIQVRGSSGFGVFKGMLMARDMGPDEAPIQIPTSMIKLGPSRLSNPLDSASLLIRSVHPNSTNLMMDRLLSGKGTTASFRNVSVAQKKFSDMFKQLWLGLQVPLEICDAYIAASKQEENLQHAFVVGLADPTCGGLPRGTVYIPGLNHQGNIFVTRSPCIESADGRLVPVVNTKPACLSEESWAFLENLPFGSIIFSEPARGETPMPVQIADGDLDGDLYFICWNDTIIDHVKAEPLNPLPGYDDVEKILNYREDWLSEAQSRMADAVTTQTMSEAIGKLYNKAKAIAEKSDQFMDDKDYKAFAAAYKQALKIGKHGGKISLPKRLHGELTHKFCHILEDSEEML